METTLASKDNLRLFQTQTTFIYDGTNIALDVYVNSQKCQ